MNRELSSRRSSPQIEAFLRSDPAAPLTVAVGFASVRGLAWLAARTADRPVTLVIGDCRRRYFAKASSTDREIALSFLARGDVTVKNWYRKYPVPAEAHLKVWIAYTEKGPAALVGSANLTAAGLFRNWEMVAEPGPSDLPRVVDEVEALVDQAVNAKPRLMEHIRVDRDKPPPERRQADRTKQTRSPQTDKQPTGRGRRPDRRRAASPERPTPKGCLSLLLLLIGAAALLAVAFVILDRALFG